MDLFNNPALRLEKLVKFTYLKDLKTGSYRRYTYPDFIDIRFNPVTDDYPYPEAAIDMT